jgi:hypothetical protein
MRALNQHKLPQFKPIIKTQAQKSALLEVAFLKLRGGIDASHKDDKATKLLFESFTFFALADEYLLMMEVLKK